jgi:hypothetical protein
LVRGSRGTPDVSEYTWIITRRDVNVVDSGVVGQIGPKGAGLTSFVKITEFGEHFRMLDADGETRYLGYIIGDYTGHEPLEDFGRGKKCVAIEYDCDGTWTALQHPKRQHLRIRVNQPVSVRLPDGTFAEDIIHNVSLGGLQLRCPQAILELFYLGSKAIDKDNRPRITLDLAFPFPEGTVEVSVQCRVYYKKALGEDRFALGVKFDKFEANGHQHFERFLQECMRPR